MSRPHCAFLLLAALTTGCEDPLPPRIGGSSYAARLQKIEGDDQEVKRGTPVPVPPRVRLLDQWGQALPGQTVFFEVQGGGGSITGESQVTDSAGTAAVGSWTVGTALGPNTLLARAGDAVALFTVTSLHPCDVLTAIDISTTTTDSLTALDCHSGDLPYWDFYRLNAQLGPALQITLTSSSFWPHLEIASIERDRSEAEVNAPSGDSVATIRLLHGPGDYLIAASSRAGQGQPSGEYRLRTGLTSAIIENCDPTFFISFGRTTTQSVADSDCSDAEGYFDRVRFIGGGTLTTVTMSSAAFSPILVIRNAAGAVVAADTGTTTASAQVTFTPASGVHTLEARAPTAQTGSYSLQLQ